MTAPKAAAATEKKIMINGAIQMSWKQAVTLVGAVAAVVLGYADIRDQITDNADAIKTLTETIEHGMVDRWKKVDDEIHMRMFAQDNGLIPVAHKRADAGD